MIKHLSKRVRELDPWYQKMTLDKGIITTQLDRSGEHIWPKLQQLIPKSLKGKRFLDLGSNAGFYSIMLALSGAKEVIGIEKESKYIKQALFLKEYFEDKYQRKLPVTYIRAGISDLDFKSLGNFYCILALSVIYFIGRGRRKASKYEQPALDEQKRVIEQISTITDRVIIATVKKRYYNSVEYYNTIFKKNNLNVSKIINCKRPMVLYKKGVS